MTLCRTHSWHRTLPMLWPSVAPTIEWCCVLPSISAVPATHSSGARISSRLDSARTTKSVSFVSVKILWCPQFTTSSTCKRIRVSVSSRVHAAICLFLPLVVSLKQIVCKCFWSRSSPSTQVLSTCLARNMNSSVLFSFTCKTLFQFPDTLEDRITLLCVLILLFSLVAFFQALWLTHVPSDVNLGNCYC